MSYSITFLKAVSRINSNLKQIPIRFLANQIKLSLVGFQFFYASEPLKALKVCTNEFRLIKFYNASKIDQSRIKIKEQQSSVAEFTNETLHPF